MILKVIETDYYKDVSDFLFKNNLRNKAKKIFPTYNENDKNVIEYFLAKRRDLYLVEREFDLFIIHKLQKNKEIQNV